MPEQRLSPLDDFRTSMAKLLRPPATSVYLSERPFLGYINLRGNSQDATFAQGVQDCVGIALPIRPNTISQNEFLTVLWLGPDEWLLVIQESLTAKISSSLRKVSQRLHVAINELSDAQTLLFLSGPRVRDVLQAGCSLDLHPSAFIQGQCAQTSMAKAGVILWRAGDDSGFFLIVRRSFSEYLALWIQDAAAPWGFELV